MHCLTIESKMMQRNNENSACGRNSLTSRCMDSCIDQQKTVNNKTWKIFFERTFDFHNHTIDIHRRRFTITRLHRIVMNMQILVDGLYCLWLFRCGFYCGFQLIDHNFCDFNVEFLQNQMCHNILDEHEILDTQK